MWVSALSLLVVKFYPHIFLLTIILLPSLEPQELASSPGRFFPYYIERTPKGEKNGPVFIAWAIVNMRQIVRIFSVKCTVNSSTIPVSVNSDPAI